LHTGSIINPTVWSHSALCEIWSNCICEYEVYDLLWCDT